MDFNDLIPELLVTDIGVSEEFYTAELGFSVAFRRDGFVFLSFNSTQLMITQLKSDSWVNGEPVAPFGRGMNLTFKVTSEWLDSMVFSPNDVFLPLQSENYQTGDVETVVRQTIGLLDSFYLSKLSVSNRITNCSSRQLTVGDFGLNWV